MLSLEASTDCSSHTHATHTNGLKRAQTKQLSAGYSPEPLASMSRALSVIRTVLKLFLINNKIRYLY